MAIVWASLIAIAISGVHAETLVPAIFFLGDSLLDVGNNNHLFTLSKANFPPYGRDFDSHSPTGRFCNGRLTADFQSSNLGLGIRPPYLGPQVSDKELLQGVNFASAACGILDDTGEVYGQCIPFRGQLDYLEEAKQRIQTIIGAEQQTLLFQKAIFFLTIGANDYLSNYLVNGTVANLQYTPKQFEDLVVATYRAHLERLYSIGARKIWVVLIPPIGCVPRILYNFNSDGSCVDSINALVDGVNLAIKSVIAQLRASLLQSAIAFQDTTNFFKSIFYSPQSYGIKVASTACCGVGKFNGALFCFSQEEACNNADEHVFFDAFHPSTFTNFLITREAFHGSLGDPFNLKQLALYDFSTPFG